MKEPAAIWSSSLIVFDKQIGLTQNVILAQARSSLKATIDRVSKLHNIIERSVIKNVFFDDDIPPTLSDLCYQAGIAATILFKDGVQGSQESALAYKLRQERIQYVKNILRLNDFTPKVLIDKKVRNSLTHIDEKIPKLLSKESNVGWFVDAAMMNRDEFKPDKNIKVKFCRSYIHSENKILHLDLELDVGQLVNECLILLRIIYGIDHKLKS